MKMNELIKALNHMKVQTGSLMCLGCGYEHSCGLHGCAIIREAADKIEKLNDFTNSQCADCWKSFRKQRRLFRAGSAWKNGCRNLNK